MEQFQQLAIRVAALEKLYEESDIEINGDKLLLQNMKKRFSISDPMALVQLSERLHSAEITLGNMLSMLYELASRTPGVIEAVGTLEAIPGIFTPPVLDDNSLEATDGILSQSLTTLNDSALEISSILHEIKRPIPRWRLYLQASSYDYKLNEVIFNFVLF